MTKKIISTVLCMVMLLSVVGVSALTQTTTDTIGRVIYEDDFDHNAASTAVNANTGTLYTSQVLIPTTTGGSDTDTQASRGKGIMTSVTGVNGASTIAFVSNASSGKAYLRTIDLDFGSTTATKAYEFSYDFQVDTLPTGTLNILTRTYKDSVWKLFNLSTGGKIQTTTDGSSYTDSMDYSANSWYHVKAILKGTSIKAWIIDSAGNSCYSEISGVSQISVSPYFWNNAGNKITLDNLKIVEYNSSTNAPTVVTAPAIAGNTSVSVDTATVDVTMDQALDVASSTATLASAGDCTIAVKDIDTYTYTVTLPELASGTAYTLNLSGLKNLVGTAAGNTAKYTFTTAAPYAAPCVVSSTPAAGASDVLRSTKTMTVTFNKALTTAPASVTLTGGAAPVTAAVSTVDNITYTFTWTENLASNTTYAVDLSGFGDGTSAVSASLSFTSENTGIIQITDGFENVTDTSGYNTYSSGVINNASIPLTTGDAYVRGYVSSATGYTGNALKLTTGGSASNKCINPLQTASAYTPQSTVLNEETVYEKFVVTYRINFDSIISNTYGQDIDLKGNDTVAYTDGGALIRIGAAASVNDFDAIAFISSDSEKAYIAHNNSTDRKTEIAEDHWYNIVFTIDGNNQNFALIDAEGADKGSVVWSYSKTIDNYAAGDAVTIFPMYAFRYASNSQGEVYNNNLSVLLDDFTLWKIKPWSDEHALVVNSVTENDGTFAMTFNQPVMGTEEMLAVATAVGEPPYNYDVAFDAEFIYPDFCNQTATVSGLSYLTDYVLDYSGLQGLSGSGISESATSLKAFTTGRDTEYDVTFVGNATYAEGSVSFGLYSQAGATPKVYVAYYQAGDLVAVKVPAETVSIQATQTTEMTVSATAEHFDNIKVFVWTDGLSPLMRIHNQTLSAQ